MKVHSNYSKVYVSGENVVPYYAEAFGMEESKIYPLGVPRTDFFFDFDRVREANEKFYVEYPEMINKKVLLYAPTFRGSSHAPDNFSCPIDIGILRKILGDEYALIIHLHNNPSSPLYEKKKNHGLKKKIKTLLFCIDEKYIDEKYTIEELMVVADILITDYSSIIFDYSLLERPIIFYANDLQAYLQERDFYFEYRNFIPGPLFDETTTLGDWILNEKYDLTKITEFKRSFFDYLDGSSAKRIVDHIHGKDAVKIGQTSPRKSPELISKP